MNSASFRINYGDFDELNNIKRFLIENGFTHTNADALDSVSKLIYKSTYEPVLVMTHEYAVLAAERSSGNNCRTKLGYYIKLNFDSVRDKLRNNYSCDIGEFFTGVKSFIERVALVYSLYVRR